MKKYYIAGQIQRLFVSSIDDVCFLLFCGRKVHRKKDGDPLIFPPVPEISSPVQKAGIFDMEQTLGQHFIPGMQKTTGLFGFFSFFKEL